MILVGFVIGEKGWFDDKSRGLLAKLVLKLLFPAICSTPSQRFTAADLLIMLPILRFPALSMVILPWHRDSSSKDLCGEEQDRRGLFISCF